MFTALVTTIPVGGWTRVYATNSTDATFPSRIPTATNPAGNPGIIALGATRMNPLTLALAPYGTGADNSTLDLRVIGWRKLINPTDESTALWIPSVLAQVSCVLGASVGVASRVVIATERFADTFTVTAGTGARSTLISPIGDGIGTILVETLGYDLVEVTFDLVSATGANALYAAF